jgi:hypothetical protein
MIPIFFRDKNKKAEEILCLSFFYKPTTVNAFPIVRFIPTQSENFARCTGVGKFSEYLFFSFFYLSVVTLIHKPTLEALFSCFFYHRLNLLQNDFFGF